MLSKDVERYLALRRATGFKFEEGSSHLRSFARFAEARGDKMIRTSTVVEWAGQGSSPLQCHRRIKVAALLARFLRAEEEGHEIPPHNLFHAKTPRPTAYVLSDVEISRLVACASDLGPPGSLRPHVYATLLGLLSATGLRRGEALALRFKDFDGVGLHVRETKFRKERWIPLHETSIDALARYLTLRQSFRCNTDHMFVSITRRRPLTGHAVRIVFHEACDRAGISRRFGRRARLHDLRHTFAVRALERAPTGRDNVNRHMVALMTYMGHAQIESSYWYLQATPELLIDISQKCEELTEGGTR